MRHALLSLAFLLVHVGAASALAHQDRCFEWSEAAPIVLREKLVSAKDVHAQARQRIAGELIRITLCEEKGQFVYKLVVQQGSRVRHLTVDARSPF